MSNKSKETQFLTHFDEVSKRSGKSYFGELTRHVCTSLGANISFVGRLIDNNESIQTVSLCHGGKVVSNIKYPLANTPCLETISTEFCLYQSMVQTRFPLDDYFKIHDIEAYVGIPLLDDEGGVIGELVGLCHAKIDKNNPVIDGVRAAADRCAMELRNYIDHEKNIEKTVALIIPIKWR